MTAVEVDSWLELANSLPTGGSKDIKIALKNINGVLGKVVPSLSLLISLDMVSIALFLPATAYLPELKAHHANNV